MHGARLRLDPRKSQATSRPIRILPSPASVTLPIRQHGSDDVQPLVAVGDEVAQGQPVACAANRFDGWLHSPISGRVVSIDEAQPDASGVREPAIRIEAENVGGNGNVGGSGGRVHAAERIPDYRSLAPRELIEAIGRGGIVGLGGAAFPTATKLTEALGREPLTLLLNGVECEPYISCDDLLMRERAPQILHGAQVLMHALSAQRCVVAIEGNKPQARDAMQLGLDALKDPRISIVLVPTLYPAGGERQLILTTLSREVPHRGLPADVNVVCHNVGTAAAVARWILDGVPLITRVVTIAGAGVREPQNLEAAIGTPIASLIEACGGYTADVQRLIMGGSMMGLALPSDALPLLKATNCVIAVSHDEMGARGPEMPCIRCGDCADVCPAALLPQQLHWYSRREDRESLQTFGLPDCIECGCCDYVCPSQIPLTHEFRLAKEWLLPLLDADQRATHARLRFESRTARLASEEAERLRKRAALKAQARGEKN